MVTTCNCSVQRCVLQNAKNGTCHSHAKWPIFQLWEIPKKNCTWLLFFSSSLCQNFLRVQQKSINNWDLSFKEKPQNECDFHVFLCGGALPVFFVCLVWEFSLFCFKCVFFQVKLWSRKTITNYKGNIKKVYYILPAASFHERVTSEFY